MAFKFDTSEVQKILYNNKNVRSVWFNGQQVWNRVEGVWVFNRILNAAGVTHEEDVSITSDDTTYDAIYFSSGLLAYGKVGSASHFVVYNTSSQLGNWYEGQEYRTIEFNSPTIVSNNFYNFLTANATYSGCATHTYVDGEEELPTCTEDGYRYSTCSVCGAIKRVTLPALGHLEELQRVDPTCTEQGYTLHTCSRCDYSYKDNYIAATGHDYTVTYSWNGYTSCTAIRTCNNGCGSSNAVGGTITNAVTTAATCTTNGVRTYTATFSGVSWASTQTKTQTIAATGHSWNTITYSWNIGSMECTASKVCKNNSGHVETSTVSITSQVTTEPTCTSAGVRTYYATFSSAWGGNQTTTRTIAATGHDWNSATYTWSSDNSTCTATRTCKTNSSHKETKTVNTTSTVITAATCTTTGSEKYTATFTGTSWAATQTKTVTIPATGHNWNATTYSWTGYTACRATRTCKNATHPEYVDAQSIVNEVTQEPTCTATGIRKYYARFNQSWAATQTKQQIIAATGHDWEDATYTAPQTCINCGATQGYKLHALTSGTTYNITVPSGSCRVYGSCSIRGTAYQFDETVSVGTGAFEYTPELLVYKDVGKWYFDLRTPTSAVTIHTITSSSAIPPVSSISSITITNASSVTEATETDKATLTIYVDYYGAMQIDYTSNGAAKTVTGASDTTTVIEADCGTEITFTHLEGESPWFNEMGSWTKVSSSGNTATYLVPSAVGSYTVTFDHS